LPSRWMIRSGSSMPGV